MRDPLGTVGEQTTEQGVLLPRPFSQLPHQGAQSGPLGDQQDADADPREATAGGTPADRVPVPPEGLPHRPVCEVDLSCPSALTAIHG